MEYYNQVFDPASESLDSWTLQTFEQCTFKNLDLAGALFIGSNFINCHFENCDLTKVLTKNARFDDVSFTNCKLNSVDFSPCNPFGFHTDFQNCQLNNTVFLNRKLKKARFIECSLKSAQFLKCDLAGTQFKECNFDSARFEDNTLTQVDFSSSYNLELDPAANRVKKARFSLHNLPGLLTKYDLVITS